MILRLKIHCCVLTKPCPLNAANVVVFQRTGVKSVPHADYFFRVSQSNFQFVPLSLWLSVLKMESIVDIKTKEAYLVLI